MPTRRRHCICASSSVVPRLKSRKNSSREGECQRVMVMMMSYTAIQWKNNSHSEPYPAQPTHNICTLFCIYKLSYLFLGRKLAFIYFQHLTPSRVGGSNAQEGINWNLNRVLFRYPQIHCLRFGCTCRWFIQQRQRMERKSKLNLNVRCHAKNY